MSKQRLVLVVEDDTDIREILVYHIEKLGWKAHGVSTGEEVEQLVLNLKPDLILLDWMLPGMSGLNVCKTIRQNESIAKTPIIMITAKDQESDVITGLEFGADDYISKPFSPREVVARIQAQVRRSDMSTTESKVAVATDEQLVVGPIAANLSKHQVQLRGRPLQLTLAEFRILTKLMLRPGIVFSRDQLLESMNGGEVYVIDRNVDVHVRSIRKKLETDASLIETVRGVGYRMSEITN